MAKKFLIAGIDESGRGSLIGPMILAGVIIDKKYEKDMIKIGVKDSKELSPRRREELAKEIEKIAKDIVILRVPACKIYSYIKKKVNLNKIEAMKIAEIIEMTNFDKIFIDAPQKINNGGMKPDKFIKLILSFLKNPEKKKSKIVVDNYLDESIPIVSAASIIAKVERDKQVEELNRKLDIQLINGYPSDPKAIEFVEKNILYGAEPSPYVRWHWSSVGDIAERLKREGKKFQPWVESEILNKDSWQRKLKDFLFKKKKENCIEEKS